MLQLVIWKRSRLCELVKVGRQGGYVYCVTLTLPENNGTKKADLQGALTLYTNLF